MPCTTFLAGRAATADGSTFAARNEDAASGHYDPKKFIVVHPCDQPRLYRSVLSHVQIPLPDDPMRYTAMPNAIDAEGIWGAAGVNEANVSMTATETITSNPRVQGADPLVTLIPAENGQKERPGGIGEEDIVTLVLPYIHSAREGVLRLGSLLEKYGTYEKNGIAFQDEGEVWWLETIGGHHWIARRVPDNAYVVMPNQLGIDSFDLEDAFGAKKDHLCSADLREFIRTNSLDLAMDPALPFNPRLAFGSHSDADHEYNTPRAWAAQRYLNPRSCVWDGEDADYRPDSDDIPWARIPERKITPEDVKYVLSGHYQGTPFDPYGNQNGSALRGTLRPAGINRNNFLSLVQIRPGLPREIRVLEWIAFGSNTFNALIPFYAGVERTPEYLADTTAEVTTESFYWTNRIIAALADTRYRQCLPLIERYQESVTGEARRLILAADQIWLAENRNEEDRRVGLRFCSDINDNIAAYVKSETSRLLDKVLLLSSNIMKNSFGRSDG